MKLLLDENLSHRLVSRLTEAFPETAHVDTLGLQGQPDIAIWEYAAREGFVLVSKDDDFRQLSFLHGPPPKVIWLIVGNAGTDAIAELLVGSRDAITRFVERAEDALLRLRVSSSDAT